MRAKRWCAVLILSPCLTDRLLRERIRRNRSHQNFDYEDSFEESFDGSSAEQPVIERLVVVANRLPVTCSKNAEGQWSFTVRL